jgi:hypothetical protein
MKRSRGENDSDKELESTSSHSEQDQFGGSRRRGPPTFPRHAMSSTPQREVAPNVAAASAPSDAIVAVVSDDDDDMDEDDADSKRETLESYRCIAAAWLTSLSDSKFNRELTDEIEAFLFDVTIAMSSLDVPESVPVRIKTFGKKWQELKIAYVALKPKHEE